MVTQLGSVFVCVAVYLLVKMEARVCVCVSTVSCVGTK